MHVDVLTHIRGNWLDELMKMGVCDGWDDLKEPDRVSIVKRELSTL